MDFIDTLKQFATRVAKIKCQIATEEATKMSLILPFFQILGYDVFNPDEFIPEFTADVGIKKGEKVDYAITFNGEPTILLEAKWCGENLDNHSSQLFRYFGTSNAKFAILTNGLVYRFYTDLDEQNKMDLSPFLEFDFLNLKENLVSEIKKFHKDNFDVDSVFSTASELKYSKLIKDFMSDQLKIPDNDFVKFLLSKIYEGVKTQNVIDKFNPIVQKSLNDFITELMNEKIKAALKTEIKQPESIKEEIAVTTEPATVAKIITTEVDLQTFYIIKSILADTIPLDKITYKDTESYLGILYNNNTRKWICRIKFGEKIKNLILPAENNKFTVKPFTALEDLYTYKEDIINSAKQYISEV